jgi:hypothetical protein
MAPVHTKYITPNKRSVERSVDLDKQFFPTLKETIKSVSLPKSFASVTKKVDPIIIVAPIISDVKPGWVHIRKHKSQIQFKSNATNKFTCTLEDEIYEEKRLGNYLFKKRVWFQQEYRDHQNELLGDLSPYWNAKTITEMHEEDEYQEGDYEENSDYSE